MTTRERIGVYTYIQNLHTLVTNYYQKLKTASEGIAEGDDVGRTADGAFNLHPPRWIKS